MILMVLSDGETYSELEGCKIVRIPDNVDTEDVESLLKKHRDGETTFGLVEVLARMG
jgi:hypothetical protein